MEADRERYRARRVLRPKWGGWCALGLILSLANGASAESPVSPPSFAVDVMAVLSKAGCNSGACHGNQNGKGGFRLSLRGENPAFDYAMLVRDQAGRRVNRLDPLASLLLEKPSGRLAHEGGVRLPHDSSSFAILRDWILAGTPGPAATSATLTAIDVTPQYAVIEAPHDRVQISVQAQFSDGAHRDVTTMAVYEPSSVAIHVTPDGTVIRNGPTEAVVVVRYLDRQVPVRVAFLDAVAEYQPPAVTPANYVDHWIDEKLQRLKIIPSPLCDDATFVRRAYLDALGILPTADESHSFTKDSRADKRPRLIDQLLARPEFVDHWALKWSDLLRNEEKVLDTKGVDVYYGWIRDSMRSGKPLNQFVSELVSARGSTYEVPAANYYRANRDAMIRGETTARVFLGIRLQCARCHNHPFDRWTQDDYYSWASCFEGIDYEIVKNERLDKLDKHEYVGEQIVTFKSGAAVTNPRSGDDAPPRFLNSPLNPDEPPDRLTALADWLTAADNPWFSRVLANLIWYHTMQRGLVEPLDDFRTTNPPTHPELLDALAGDLVRHGFDLRHLIRVVMNSQAYQRSSLPVAGNAHDQDNYARAIVRRLTAEQLLDAQSQVLDVPGDFAGYPRGLRAGQIPGVKLVRERDDGPASGDRFLRTFGKPERLLACECERSNETTLGQTFLLIAGEDIQARLADDQGRLKQWADSQRPPPELIVELYWTALGRAPSATERAACEQVLQQEPDRFTALQDMTWALLNSKEFVFRH
jgi:hypothetical protein